MKKAGHRHIQLSTELLKQNRAGVLKQVSLRRLMSFITNCLLPSGAIHTVDYLVRGSTNRHTALWAPQAARLHVHINLWGAPRRLFLQALRRGNVNDNGRVLY